MLDFSHVPNAQNGADIQIFRATGQQFDWKTWVKPRGKSMALFTLTSAGGGGGGGFSRTAGTAGGGGGGGGSGATSSVLVNLRALIPDILYVCVGVGNPGGTAGVAGQPGGYSYISIAPDSTASAGNRVAFAGATNAGGGGAGTASAAGASGTAANGMPPAGMGLGMFGISSTLSGVAGGAGGAQTGAAGAGVTYNSVTSGGGGGAGSTTTDFAGGAYIGSGAYPSLAGGVAAGGRGLDGYELSPGGVFMPVPVIFLPGTGGGSNNSGVGGAGGNGAIGCGGGGGGAGVTGGAGGRGGDGLVVIACW